MTELLTAAQMKAIEKAAIASGKVTGLELMERAGQGVVEAIFEEWPETRTAPQSVCVLSGPGNNGGDGFVVARLLKKAGWVVRVLFLGDENKLGPDAMVNFVLWSELGAIESLTEKNLRSEPSYIYVDALFGTGLTRPLERDALDVITHMWGRNGDDYSKITIAIDAPSGMCMDSGRMLDGDWKFFTQARKKFATVTVCFDGPKIGHFVGDGPDICGKLVVKARIPQVVGPEQRLQATRWM